MNVKHHQNKIMDSLDRVHHVLVIEDPSFYREINLDAATYSLGRHSSNDIVLSCQKTSRNHATLLRRTDIKTNRYAYWILDGDLQGNRSRNGIYINGKKTLVHELKHGDVIQFSGDARAIYKITTELPKTNYQNGSSDNSSLEPEPSKSINKETIAVPELNTTNNHKPIQTEISHQNQVYWTELSPQPIIEIDLYGNITYINPAGISNFRDIHYQKLNHPLLNNLVTQYHQGRDNIITREVQVGNKIFFQTAHYLPENKVIRNYIVDITQQKAFEQKLQYQLNLYNKVIQHISEVVMVVEPATKQIVEVNPACSNLLGYSPEQMLQMNIYELCCASEKLAVVLQRVIADKNSFWGECLLRHHNGDIIKTQIKIDLISSGTNQRLCLLIDALNQEQTNTQAKPQLSESTLSKKEAFQQQMLTAIANAQRSQTLLAVMFCKLYFLPDIRANLGIEKTQELLSNLCKRLSTCLRSGDTVVHWQEDKFAILMPQINGIEEVAKINQRIKQSIQQSFKLGKINVTLNGSIGVAIYPQDGENADILLANAHTALERAYNNQQSYQFYDRAMNSQTLVALELETLLQQALQKEEFQLYYQPQINLDTGKTEAIKALLRWQHPELGLVPPSNFIRAAEKNNLIVPIGEWAIHRACRQNKAWQGEGLPPLPITVSLSSVQFKQTNLVAKIAEILAETTLEPQLLELEISAVSLLENIDRSKIVLHHLEELGVKIAVDDFTSGFSTLEYLKDFPLNTLKIDRSLVQKLTDSPKDLAIATALIELGKGFGLRVVAEGVETQEQVDLLRSLNCQHMQGFWFGRPLAAKEARKLLSLNDSELEIDKTKEPKHSTSGQTLEQMAHTLEQESASLRNQEN